MPKGYWGFVLAIGLISVVVPVNCVRGQEQRQANNEKIEIPVAPYWGLNKPYEREQSDEPCEKGADNRNSDLCAQWKAADAAREAANWVEPTFQLGVGGLVVGFLTFIAAVAAAIFAGAAARHTEKGSNAAIEAVNVTREIGSVQLRAYLSAEIDSIRIDAVSESPGVQMPFNGKHRIGIRTCIRNCGATPANNVRFGARLEVIDEKVSDFGYAGGPHVLPNPTDNLGSIAPAQCAPITSAENCEFDAAKILSKDQNVLIVGVVEYETVKGNGRTTILCHVVDLNEFARSVIAREPKRRLSTARARHGNEMR